MGDKQKSIQWISDELYKKLYSDIDDKIKDDEYYLMEMNNDYIAIYRNGWLYESKNPYQNYNGSIDTIYNNRKYIGTIDTVKDLNVAWSLIKMNRQLRDEIYQNMLRYDVKIYHSYFGKFF